MKSPINLFIGSVAALSLIGGAVAVSPTFAATHASAKGKTWTVNEVTGKATAGFVFSPAKLKIKVGDTVIFKDKSSAPHNVVGTNNKLIKRTAINSATYKVTFKKAGDFKYVCQIHPGMVGEIIVKK